MKRFVLFSMLLLCILLVNSCSVDGSVYKPLYHNYRFSQYTFPNGSTTGYASVLCLSEETDYPKVVRIDDKEYNVAIFDGYAKEEDVSGLTEIKLKDYITAISSNAFEKAVNITKLKLPNTITSLGTACLPCNLTSLEVSGEAICEYGTKRLWYALSSPEKLESLTISSPASTRIDLSNFNGEGNALNSITVKGQNAVWPELPQLRREGMKFLGWWTADPTEIDSSKAIGAVKVESGERLTEWSMTVHPYFEEGEDDPVEDPNEPSESFMPGLNAIRVYTFNFDRNLLDIEKNEESGEYTIRIDVMGGWYFNWTYNGAVDERADKTIYRFTPDPKRRSTQVACYLLNENGRVAGGAFMIEVSP